MSGITSGGEFIKNFALTRQPPINITRQYHVYIYLLRLSSELSSSVFELFFCFESLFLNIGYF